MRLDGRGVKRVTDGTQPHQKRVHGDWLDALYDYSARLTAAALAADDHFRPHAENVVHILDVAGTQADRAGQVGAADVFGTVGAVDAQLAAQTDPAVAQRIAGSPPSIARSRPR